MKLKHCIFLYLTFFFVPQALAADAALSVWVNEAIISTYTFSHQNFIERQREIAKYFTTKGWTAYSKAFLESKLPDKVKKNQYKVTAVALMPPEIKQINPQNWQAVMPILVVFQNPQYKQKQTLEMTAYFTTAPSGQGVRGLAITSLRSKVTEPPCRCQQAPEAKDKGS